ncbi:MAG: patatin-like phospholipase family protein, partial [Proteobacteria bacterium]|nr:patatin-like phospholipase family protein [Pseudomonadota bacterium]
MRASMSVPLVFGPVKHQGRMLVDGGILHNLPVDVVRQMGADIVIAVDISSPLGVVNENSSVLSITYQSVDVALVQNTIQSLKLADIIIAPELIGTSASDFEKTDAMIADGYKATMAKSLVLNGFRLDKQQYLTHLDSRNYLPRSVPHIISFVDFSGNKRTSSKRLMAQSKALIGKEFNNDMVQQVADAIVVFEEDIEIISYNIAKKNGEGGVVFNVQEKQWGPDYLKFGLKIADDFDSNTRISVLTRHHRYNINSKGGQWINDFSIGSTLSWKSELYQPIDFNNKYFATANLHTIKDTRRFYINDGAVGEYDFKQFAFGLSLGINPNENSEFRAGLWYQDENVAQVINAINFDTAINDTVGLKINYGIDTLEKVIYPRRGFDLKTEIGVFDQIQWFSFDGFKRFPFFANSAAHIGFKADFTDLVNNNEFFKAYGGLDDFAGFPQHSLLGLNAFIVEAGWFTQLQTLTFPVIGTPDIILKTHWGNVWQGHIKLENMIYGASAGLSFDIQNTLLFLGSGYSKQGDFRFYLRLGTGF